MEQPVIVPPGVTSPLHPPCEKSPVLSRAGRREEDEDGRGMNAIAPGFTTNSVKTARNVNIGTCLFFSDVILLFDNITELNIVVDG